VEVKYQAGVAREKDDGGGRCRASRIAEQLGGVECLNRASERALDSFFLSSPRPIFSLPFFFLEGKHRVRIVFVHFYLGTRVFKGLTVVQGDSSNTPSS